MTINFLNLKNINLNLNQYSNSELMIVTKNQKQEDIIDLIENGYSFFGENKVQEMAAKFSSLKPNYNFTVHLIGPLQSNKVKLALTIADTIQSLDRIKLVNEIKKYWNAKSVTKDFYIQVNIGEEQQKSGVNPNEVKTFYQYCIKQGLTISGLMCIPPNVKDPTKYFHRMLNIRNEINPKLKLSMGMSNDYILALKNQSNMIRVGSLIFD